MTTAPVSVSADAQPSSSSATSPSPKDHDFRTVLPHEPLPRDDGPGYLHIQGSFQPKISGSAVVNRKEDEQGVTDDTNHATGQCQETVFWTSDSLQEALSAYFIPQSTESEQECSDRAATAPTKVQVLDQSPPFTKVRLEYASTRQAYCAIRQLRQKGIAPSDIFDGLSAASSESVTASASSGSLTFSSRPLQVTLITRQPLLEPGWSRSTPPKFRRLIAKNNSESEAILQRERQETRFVWMSNLFAHGPNSNNDDQFEAILHNRFAVADAIRKVVNKYDSIGLGVEVFLSSNRKSRNPAGVSCHIGMRSPADAQALIQNLQGQRVIWTFQEPDGASAREILSGDLFLDYAAITQRSAQLDQAKSQGLELPRGEVTRPECTSATAHVNIPGLIIVEDFITEAQEAVLMAVVTGPQAPWAPSQVNPSETGAVRRRVQHYGYVFDYKTANVLRNRSESGADCPPMPALDDPNSKKSSAKDLAYYLDECVDTGEGWGLLAGIAEHVRRYDFGRDGKRVVYSSLNQLTVNQYRPGEGIGSHVDTPSAFGDGLLSLTLNSGIVMEFRKVNVKDGEDRKKLVYLPRRSLVLMSGAARYEWEHMIVTRTTDVHEGELLPRGLRISLTFRTALEEDHVPMPLVESNLFPPTWGSENDLSSSLRAPACEREHVHAVYDAIATQWHHTRGRRGVLWPGATKFLQELEPGSVVADIGCGDGKYFPAIWQGGSYVIGNDISIPLLKMAFLADQEETDTPENRRVSDERRHLSDRPAVCAADCMIIPFQSKRFDAAICIAVLHHLSTRSRRQRCIEELVRIVKPGGLINIQAWAFKQEKDSPRTFVASDVFVPFNAQPKYLKTIANSELSVGKEHNFGHKSTAQVYSEALNADFDNRKGLVVFKRYCHMYKHGELEDLLIGMSDLELVDSGFEAGNYYIILRVVK